MPLPMPCDPTNQAPDIDPGELTVIKPNSDAVDGTTDPLLVDELIGGHTFKLWMERNYITLHHEGPQARATLWKHGLEEHVILHEEVSETEYGAIDKLCRATGIMPFLIQQKLTNQMLIG